MATTIVPRFDGTIIRSVETIRETAQQWLDESQGDCDKAGDVDDANWYQGKVDALTDILVLMTSRHCEKCGAYESHSDRPCPGTEDGLHVWDQPESTTTTSTEWGFRHEGWPHAGIGPHVETQYTGHDGWTTGPYTEDNIRYYASGRPVVKRTRNVTTILTDWEEVTA